MRMPWISCERRSIRAMQRPNHRVLVAEVGEKVQRLLGLVGVAVQRDARAKPLCCVLVAPQVRDGRIGHVSSSIRDLTWFLTIQFDVCTINAALRVARITLQLSNGINQVN